jgi:hypothetical protein
MGVAVLLPTDLEVTDIDSQPLASVQPPGGSGAGVGSQQRTSKDVRGACKRTRCRRPVVVPHAVAGMPTVMMSW